jgi:integrase
MNDDALLFRRTDGGPMLPDTLSKRWERMMKRLGLPGVRLHDARHTHASLMLKAGIHPKIVQERLGHSTISVTLDTYSHVAPGLQEAAAQHFDELFTQPAPVATGALSRGRR